MPANTLGWRVTGQQHAETYMPGGGFEEVVYVNFVTKNGTHAKVTVPVAQYTAQNVSDMIDAFAEREDAVAQLGKPKG